MGRYKVIYKTARNTIHCFAHTLYLSTHNKDLVPSQKRLEELTGEIFTLQLTQEIVAGKSNVSLVCNDGLLTPRGQNI